MLRVCADARLTQNQTNRDVHAQSFVLPRRFCLSTRRYGQCRTITPEGARQLLASVDAEIGSLPDEDGSVYVLDYRLNGLSQTLRLTDCEPDIGCQVAIIFATFDPPADVPPVQLLDAANRYNDSYPFGRAFVLPNNDGSVRAIGVDYSLDLRNETSLDAVDLNLFYQIVVAYTDHHSEGAGE